jgi:hypothetical protein
VGIDIGSYGSRVCIWKSDTGTDIVVENPQYYVLTRAYTPCDFSSALYVFDDDNSQDLYLPKEEDPSRRCVSAKLVLYILANASSSMLEQSPLARHLMEKYAEPGFAAQLWRGMAALLSDLRDAASAVCRERGFRIVKIGLTLSMQWDLQFTDVYRALVRKVFKMDSVTQISLFAETDALLRYLYKHHAHKLDPSGQYDAILFFDFGGCHMVIRLPSSLIDVEVLTLVLNRTVVSFRLFGAVRVESAFPRPGLLLVRRVTLQAVNPKINAHHLSYRCCRRIRAMGTPHRPMVSRSVWHSYTSGRV